MNFFNFFKNKFFLGSKIGFLGILIHDEPPDPQIGPDRLIGLEVLIEAISLTDPSLLSGIWRLYWGLDGSGQRISEMSDLLWDEKKLFIERDFNSVKEILDGGEERFGNVNIEVPSSGIELGIHDWTLLYLVGPAEFIKKAAKRFKETEIVPPEEASTFRKYAISQYNKWLKKRF